MVCFHDDKANDTSMEASDSTINRYLAKHIETNRKVTDFSSLSFCSRARVVTESMGRQPFQSETYAQIDEYFHAVSLADIENESPRREDEFPLPR